MLNNIEKSIVSQFIQNLDRYGNETMILIWDTDNKVCALFETCFEDENDYDARDDRFEEFVSFAFTALSIEGNPPIYITKDSCFLVSYHNFPDIILSKNGKKIN